MIRSNDQDIETEFGAAYQTNVLHEPIYAAKDTLSSQQLLLLFIIKDWEI